jgi:Kef-type K+ transport system membrane component KefB
MMDDVVGLVMVQIISNLGGDNFSWVTVVRPVLVSVAFALVAPLVCLSIAKPATLRLNQYREAHALGKLNKLLRRKSTAFALHTLLLVGLVTAATYAGTSNLFAAYIAGAGISWWDSDVPHTVIQAKASHMAEEDDRNVADLPATSAEQPLSVETESELRSAQLVSTSTVDGNNADTQLSQTSDTADDSSETSGTAIYEHYYYPAVSKILQPLFFASVGFSIPVTQMFRGSIVWRGIVYAVLMAFAKLVCGLWLVRFSKNPGSKKGTVSRLLSKLRVPPHLCGKGQQSPRGDAPNTQTSPCTLDTRNTSNPQKPFSLHPPLILGLAMCARGEIGFLISGVAESKGVFSPLSGMSNGPSDIFLVVTWAIVLCTIAGPLGVGLSVRRVKMLEERKNEQEGTVRNVLGGWGVN